MNNLYLWYCDGSEKGATASTSFLVESSKSRTDDCAGKGGRTEAVKRKLEAIRGCLVLKMGSKLKKLKRKGALIGNEIRRLTKAQSNGPKYISNNNEKVAFTKFSSPFFYACNQGEALEEDQAHLLAQSSLKQGLYLGGRKSPRSLANYVSSSKDASCSEDVRT